MKLRYLAAAIALAAAPAAGLAMAGSANAATPSCGGSCIDVYSADFTDGVTQHPGFVLDVYKREQKVGAPVILFRTSNQDPAEDFTVSAQGTVADFYAAGLVSPKVALHYGCTTPAFPVCVSATDDDAYELEYAPYGADTGLCAGVANEKVTLQPCGISGNTVWILDTSDASSLLPDGLAPVINGSDTNFSQPFVLTYPPSSYPTDQPRPQLYVTNITGSASGTGPVEGTVSDAQLWSAVSGPLN